jgi:prepilin-type N-terminal cleavage/methylation domain-containing protein/prepilin-type processing-associated H-X9-DG protein
LTFDSLRHSLGVMLRPGFTLTELILVIVIIALLLAFLVPSLQRSQLEAKATVCMSNIKQINTAFSAYATENSSYPYGFDKTILTPPPGDYAGNFTFDKRGWWWFNNIGELYNKSKLRKSMLECPSKQIKERGLKNNILCGNYGVNLSIFRRKMKISDPNMPCAFSEIMHPAKTLLIVDSGYAIISWQHAADSFTVILGNTQIEDTAYIPGLSINRQRQLWPGQEIDAYYNRHPKTTVNAGFADGHVVRVKAEDLLVKKITDDVYENLSPLWVPNTK